MRSNPKFYCTRCSGDGGWMDFDSIENIEVYYECPDCNSTGMLKNKTIKDEHTEGDGSIKYNAKNNVNTIHGG